MGQTKSKPCSSSRRPAKREDPNRPGTASTQVINQATKKVALPPPKAAATKGGNATKGGKTSSQIDLLFVLDTTGSMGSYIASAQANIKRIVREAQSDGNADVRFGLVSYKDYGEGAQKLSFSRHAQNRKADDERAASPVPAAAACESAAAPTPSRGLLALERSSCRARSCHAAAPRGWGSAGRSRGRGNGFEDGSAARIFDFTSDLAIMQLYVDSQRATGGGDGPEAVATALHCADLMDWREGAARIAVLITDAPPHGIEDRNDNFPNGDPGCRDCLEIGRALADKDITVYTVACEPSVTRSFQYCRDFLEGLAEITGGMLVPLKSAAMLTDLILASCKEGADLAKAQEVVQAALEKVKKENPSLQGDALAECAAARLQMEGVRVHQTRETSSAYRNFSKRNVVLFADDAATLSSCKARLEPVAEPEGWDVGLEQQQIRSEVASLSAHQCSRMMKQKRRKVGWGY